MDANLEAILKKFTKYVVSQSKSNLTRKKKNVKGNLYNSIKGDTFVSKSQKSIGVYFEMEDYGVFQDSGIKGKSSGQSLGTFKDGGFRFGSGTGQSGGLTKAINQWVRDRRFQFKDKANGKFMSYDATAFLITRSIWQKGIKPTRFFSKPFEDGIKRLPDEVVEAYGLDTENTIKKMLTQWK